MIFDPREFIHEKFGGRESEEVDLTKLTDDELDELFDEAEWSGKIVLCHAILKEADRRSKL